MKRFTKEDLFAVRNELPIMELIKGIGIPWKISEGVFRFLCPKCGEFQTGVNQATNLSRCFLCQKNFNTIEIVMEDRKLSFVESVKFLQAANLKASALSSAS